MRSYLPLKEQLPLRKRRIYAQRTRFSEVFFMIVAGPSKDKPTWQNSGTKKL